jgi:hypothetical protein
MKYRKVERVITVEFIETSAGTGYDIRVTPDEVIARYHDALVWDVQGLTEARARKIAFGNFVQIMGSGRVTFGKKGFAPARMKRLPQEDVVVGKTAKGFRAKLELGQAEPGLYKYDIKSDGETLFDPDIEIRGPRN